MRALGDRDEVALDTEGDSLHHYPERLALIQLADGAGQAWLVDPLALVDLSPLAAVLADRRHLLVVHAGDNDLVQLKRRYAFTFARIFDTSVAGRFLGVQTLGLEVLLERYLGVTLPPSRQKDDWSERPLTQAQEAYAAADVEHLIALKDVLVEELRRAGRLTWVEEECAALAAEPAEARAPDPDAWAGVKGARTLAPLGLAALRELHALREELARAADRPPFKIVGDATLLALAGALPASAEALAAIAGCTPRVISRWGGAILAALERGRALPAERLPVLPRNPRPNVPAAVRGRIEVLRQWRAGASPKLELEPGVVLPNRLIRAVAEAAPRDLEALAAVPGLQRWRAETFGRELLAALAGG
ncbi:MAG: HRDC domain-containing protein [Candidatus Rokubacteria bacterium]|nr:HRDC domain-containing protein [Candidatus Rokubacteria bacterium]